VVIRARKAAKPAAKPSVVRRRRDNVIRGRGGRK
jgi:hypothetical protein